MIKFKFNVTFTGGETVEATAGPRTQVAFERQFNTPLTDLIQADQDGVNDKGEPNVTGVHFKSEHLYWLAWHALKSQAPFDDWLDTVDEIGFDVAAADPTRPAQPAV
jgi:hypothetical protein